MKVDFDELAAEERRIILVASDAKYAEIVNRIDWRPVALAVGAPFAVLYTAGFGAPILFSLLFGHTLAASAYFGGTVLAMDRLRKAKNKERPFLHRVFSKGEIPLPHLAPSDAQSRFRFDLGGPENGAVYIANPCLPGHYLLPALVNERLAQEKLAAFIQIASALGAKKVDLISGESFKTKSKSEGYIPLPKAAAQVGLHVDFGSSKTLDRQVVAEFGKPTKSPYMPEELQGWLDREPVLRGMVRTRLDGEPTRMSIHLPFGSMVDMGAGTTAKIANWGLQVGSTYRKVASSRWSFDVEFWPKP
jgi:hypothetical protein